ncbi:MDH2 [Symbiodinium pilosum]|uniref:MDH2 protein n=1 Tax=Symbiodinium pilosum TaxID=2952 RepID=A0A812X5P4_SYMPI|nr:MDH2 [Symbiodinium pilosum]
MCASKENQILLEKHRLPKGKEQFDGILDELAAAAQAEDEAKEDQEEPEEDGWTWLKETFGWVLVADVFILIALSFWLILGQALKWLFNYDPLIATFLMYWDPYIQSLLGIFFSARLFASIFSWLASGVKSQ